MSVGGRQIAMWTRMTFCQVASTDIGFDGIVRDKGSSEVCLTWLEDTYLVQSDSCIVSIRQQLPGFEGHHRNLTGKSLVRSAGSLHIF